MGDIVTATATNPDPSTTGTSEFSDCSTGGGVCPTDLVLSGLTLSVDEAFDAIGSITIDTTTIANAVNASFLARQSVGAGNGLTVEANAIVTFGIDPTADCN